jgi:hypothetical protein
VNVLDDFSLGATKSGVAKDVAQDVECICYGRHRIKATFLR